MPAGITLDCGYGNIGAEIYPPRIILTINDLQMFGILFCYFWSRKITQKSRIESLCIKKILFKPPKNR